MRKTKPILDPLWIIKSRFLDSEYFSYVLLAASQKYKKDLEEGDLRHFYEIFFHSLNLNGLAVNGNLFDSKLHMVWKDPKIQEIKRELKNIFQRDNEILEIFRNANYVFLNLLLDYMDQHIGALELMDLYYLNDKIHEEKEIFIVVNSIGDSKYSIWCLKSDPKEDYGFSLKKIKSIRLNVLKENALKEKLTELDHPVLNRMKDKTNVFFAILEEIDESIAINVIKDTILLNKGIAKGISFEPAITSELQALLAIERLMPFTLSQWID